MVVENGQTLGLSILSAEAGFGIWSSLNPSLFTIKHFASTGDDVASLRKGMLISLGIMGGTAVGIRTAFGKKAMVPALAHVAVGLGLFALYGFEIGWKRFLSSD